MKLRCVYNPQSHRWMLLNAEQQEEQAARFIEALVIRGLSPKSIRAYAFDLLLLYRWLDSRAITSINQSDLLEFINYQRQRNSRPRSINRRLATARAFYRFLTGENIPLSAGVSLPRASIRPSVREHKLGLFRLKKPSRRQLTVTTEQRLVEPLSGEQARCFLRSLRRYRDISLVYIMLLCGLRSQEALELQLTQLNFKQKQIRVLGKGGKERLVPMPEIVFSSLHNYLQLERPQAQTNTVFVVLQGARRAQPMTAAGLRSIFRHRRGIQSLAGVHPHQCRHTFGTEMSRQGVSLHVLQKMMGHGDVSVTMQYINLSLADITEEYQRAAKEIEARYKT